MISTEGPDLTDLDLGTHEQLSPEYRMPGLPCRRELGHTGLTAYNHHHSHVP